MKNKKKIDRIVLAQSNYARFDKRTWKTHPYPLGIINACIKKEYKTELFDANFHNSSDDEVVNSLRMAKPDLVGLTTSSVEYLTEIEHMAHLIRKAVPDAIIVEGGILPTAGIKVAMRDRNIDYWIISEGEKRFPALLNELKEEKPNLAGIDGLAYYENEKPIINIPKNFIEDLDSVPFADYGNLNFLAYGNVNLKYGQGARARMFPHAIIITSRGCPYRCCFCSGPRISGSKVRLRSAENVLKEIDKLYKEGIREIIFSDDHFLFSRQRAIDIMKGLIKRNYGIPWKCENLTVWLLDEELLGLMKESGCYQMTVSIESGNQYVVDKIVKKPVNLTKVPDILKASKDKGFEIIVNFIIGFPEETWDQIRETFAYAERLDADLINFHIATPLPNTELMEICIKKGLIAEDFWENPTNIGYTKGIISTEEFTPYELQILRAFEWDRINFRTKERKEIIARIQGISMEELEEWRKATRRKLGVADGNLTAGRKKSE